MQSKIFFLAGFFLMVAGFHAAPPPPIQDSSKILENGDEVKINLKDTDIRVVVEYLARFSGEHYMIDPQAEKTKISIMANKPVKRKDAVLILEEALVFNNMSIMKHGVAKYVVPSRFAKQYGIPIKMGREGIGEINSADMEIRFFILNYVSTRRMNTILNTILGKNGQIIPHPQEKMLQVMDTTFSLQRMSEIIDKMDVPDTVMELYLIHLQNTKAAKIVNHLKAIFAKNLTLTNSPNELEAEEDKINFMNDDRTNKILVITHPKYIEQIRETVNVLDQDLGQINQIQIYSIRYADPEELKKQIEELFPKEEIKLLVDARLNSLLVISQSDRMIQAVLQMAEKLDVKGEGDASDVHVYYLEYSKAKDMADTLSKLFDKKDPKTTLKPVSIVPDEATNALVITGSRSQFEEVISVLRKLDIFRAQVLVEAVIIEVNAAYVESLGINLSAIGGAVGNSGVLAGATQMGVTLGNGLNFGVVDNTTTVEKLLKGESLPRALLRAFKNNNHSNILSAPQIMTKDNEEAQIVVGEVVPLPTGVNTALDNGNQTISNFRFEDVGLQLSVTPRITQKRTINLDVKLEVKARSNDTLFEFDVPIITRRFFDTNVTTNHGNTVVIGGLMRDQKTNNQDKIPGLSRLPWLGKIFKNKSDTTQKTNLFVFLTPYVVSDERELRELTAKMDKKIKTSNDVDFRPLSYSEKEGLHSAKSVKIEKITIDGRLESVEDLKPVTSEMKVLTKEEGAIFAEASSQIVSSVSSIERTVITTASSVLELKNSKTNNEFATSQTEKKEILTSVPAVESPQPLQENRPFSPKAHKPVVSALPGRQPLEVKSFSGTSSEEMIPMSISAPKGSRLPSKIARTKRPLRHLEKKETPPALKAAEKIVSVKESFISSAKVEMEIATPKEIKAKKAISDGVKFQMDSHKIKEKLEFLEKKVRLAKQNEALSSVPKLKMENKSLLSMPPLSSSSSSTFITDMSAKEEKISLDLKSQKSKRRGVFSRWFGNKNKQAESSSIQKTETASSEPKEQVLVIPQRTLTPQPLKTSLSLHQVHEVIQANPPLSEEDPGFEKVIVNLKKELSQKNQKEKEAEVEKLIQGLNPGQLKPALQKKDPAFENLISTLRTELSKKTQNGMDSDQGFEELIVEIRKKLLQDKI